MFLRMLKKDLHSKKGLNIILFIFIITASVLVFVSASQIYTDLTGWSKAKEQYHLKDSCITFLSSEADRDKNNKTITELFERNKEFGDFVHDEGLSLNSEFVDFSDFNTKKKADNISSLQIITRQPREVDLTYDINNKPFYVRNGEMAVPSIIMSSFGAKIGDKIRIINELGNIYEFTIAHFYKEPNTMPFRFIVSDSDYESLKAEPFQIRDFYYFNDVNNDISQSSDIAAVFSKGDIPALACLYTYDILNEHRIIADIVSAFMALMSCFMILLIFITIRFNIIAELKEREKEIGIMRAVGVDSIKFRWLFCAKYIAFSVAGGIIGVAAGFPAARILIKRFFMNVPTPGTAQLLAVGLFSVMSLIFISVFFSLLIMRKMKRISIMTAIHGENNGERFSTKRFPLLHKSKHIALPLFLAVSDIISKAKRYVFLVITYTLCITIMLLSIYFRCSVINNNFLKYNMMNIVDFEINLPDETFDLYYQRSISENKCVEQLLNEELQENNIPAHYEFYSEDYFTVYPQDNAPYNAMAIYRMKDIDSLQYSEGTTPVLKNEIAVSRFNAKRHGLKVGDIVYVDINSSDLGYGSVKREQFVITGLVDLMTLDLDYIIFSPEYIPAYESTEFTSYYSSAIIDSDNKEEVLRQIRELYGEENVRDNKEFLLSEFSDFVPVLNLMMFTLTGAVLIISTLITLLYLNIFLTEDRYDISLLKSLGFCNSSIISWQLLRMVLLSGTAILTGVILTSTLGQMFAEKLTEHMVSLTGFRFVRMPLFTFVIMPMILGITIILPSLLRLMKIHSIDFRNINEEM